MAGKGIRTQHPDYIQYAPVWKKSRDAAEGERAIHEAGTEYLPKLSAETAVEYQARKNRTPFFGAYWRTISGLKGMVFRKPSQIVVPAAVESFLPDIDMAGTPLELFAQQLFEEELEIGRGGILIDYPSVEQPGAATVAQAQRAGLRPMMQQYLAEDIINWKTARINNSMQLILLVLKEPAAIGGEDAYSHATESRYRELALTPDGYRQRVFRIAQNDSDEQVGGDIFPTMNGQPLLFIPFVFFGVDSIQPHVTSPPLEDLLNMNLHHYTVSADYEHGCHFSGLPTPYIAGWTPPNEGDLIGVGSLSFKCFDNPTAKMAYAEVAGNFTALRENKEDKKQEMAVLGARMLESQKASVESSDTQKQRVAGEQSQLGGMAQVFDMAMTKALAIFSAWAGANDEVSYITNKDFIPAGMKPEEMAALLMAVQSGQISYQTYFDNLQRGEIIAANVSAEEEQERIASQRLPEMDNGMESDLEDEGEEVEKPEFDMTALISAISNIPAPIVNVAAPVINIPATVVNIPEQSAPQITVNTPEITIQPANITVNNSDGGKTIELSYDSDGNIIGGSVQPGNR